MLTFTLHTHKYIGMVLLAGVTRLPNADSGVGQLVKNELISRSVGQNLYHFLPFFSNLTVKNDKKMIELHFIISLAINYQ